MMVKNIIRKIAGIITAIATISVYMVTAPINGYAEKSTNNGPIIVSLGDSYSSGEGIEPFIGQNEKISVRVNNPNWLAHRSEKAWSGMLTLPSISGKMSDHLGENWFFVAASGALTSHMLNHFPKKAIKDIYRNDKTTALDPQLNVFKQLGGKKADYVTLTLASKLSNSYKPLDIYYGYDDNGSTTIYDSGKIGGNSEAVSYFNSMKYLFIIGGIAFICLGGWLYSSGSKYEKIPSITKKGIVIGLDVNTASIEFDDGTRERLQYLASKVVLVIGDKGSFEIKGKFIQSFKKE